MLAWDFSEHCCFADMRELDKNTDGIRRETFNGFPPQFSVIVKAEDFNYAFPIPPLLVEKLR